MKKGIIDIVGEIANKTGVEINVYNKEGAHFVESSKQIKNVNFDSIFVDKENNQTAFKVNYLSELYILAIDGTGENSKVIANLIMQLVNNSVSKKEELTKEEFYRKVIFGKLSFFEINEYVRANGLEEKDACSLVINSLTGKIDEVSEVLQNYSNDENDLILKLDEDRIAFIKTIDEAVEEYRSVLEYAEFLYQSINEETGVHAGIYLGSEIKTFADITESFNQAFIAESIGKWTQLNGNVHSYKEYIYIKMLEDLPKHKLNEYYNILMGLSANEILEDKEMLLTAEEFLNNNLNISETSRKLYLHRNTLTYRLDKIEKATGLDLKKFSDALTFRIMVVLSKLVK